VVLSCAFFVVVLSGGPAAAGELYRTGFEAPSFSRGNFIGQDDWFAGLGPDAISVSSQLPRDGVHSVKVDGSLLEPFFTSFAGSYARPLFYDPLAAGTPFVELSGNVIFSGERPEKCGDETDFSTCISGLGLTGVMGEEFILNVQIGIRELNDRFVSFLSNYDGVSVNGPEYTFGQWSHLRAVFDFDNRTIRGYFDGQPMGEIPFTNGISNTVDFLNLFLLASDAIPNTVAYYDNISVTASTCARDSTTLCLNQDGRFKAEIEWADRAGKRGPGKALELPGEDSGLFYFFRPDNAEVLIKVLDACDRPPFNSYWVFYAATTNVEFSLTVTDTQTGQEKQYVNPFRQVAVPMLDTRAFLTCP
jgi:hypothetical protein